MNMFEIDERGLYRRGCTWRNIGAISETTGVVAKDTSLDLGVVRLVYLFAYITVINVHACLDKNNRFLELKPIRLGFNLLILLSPRIVHFRNKIIN